MSTKVIVTVIDPAVGRPVTYEQFCPIFLGRSERNEISFGHENRKISRHHATILAEGDNLLFEVSGGHGAMARDRFLTPGAREVITQKTEFEIEGVIILVEQAATISDLTLRLRVPRNPDAATALDLPRIIVGVGVAGGALKAEQFAPREYKLLLNDPSMCAIFFCQKGEFYCVRGENRDQFDIMKNRVAIDTDYVSLRTNDVVEIGNFRFELVKRDSFPVECVSPTCRLLNGRNYNANCKWCGYRLTEAQTAVRGYLE